jgi:hypothetical protein
MENQAREKTVTSSVHSSLVEREILKKLPSQGKPDNLGDRLEILAGG